MFEWFKNIFKKSYVGGAYSLFLSPFYGANSQWKYDAFAWTGYMQNPIVYRCINLIADSVAGIPWKLYRKTGQDKDIHIEHHPVLDLLKRPNPMLGGKDFFSQYVQYLELSGNVYVRAVGPSTGVPKELYFLRPDRVEIRRDNYNYTDENYGLIYEYCLGGTTERLDLRMIHHAKYWNPLCDFYGQSPLMSAASSIEQLNEALRWNVHLLRNSAAPSGVLSSDGNLTDEQIDRLKQEMSLKHQGVWNNGRPMLLEGGLKFTPMGITPKEMDFIEGIAMSTKNIALCLGIDPTLLGDAKSKTYATFRDAQKSFYMDTVLPICDKLRDDFLNLWLLPRFPGTENMYFEYDVDQVDALNESQNLLYERMVSAYQAGIIDINEAREALGFSELMEEEEPKEQEDPPDNEESSDI